MELCYTSLVPQLLSQYCINVPCTHFKECVRIYTLYKNTHRHALGCTDKHTVLLYIHRAMVRMETEATASLLRSTRHAIRDMLDTSKGGKETAEEGGVMMVVVEGVQNDRINLNVTPMDVSSTDHVVPPTHQPEDHDNIVVADSHSQPPPSDSLPPLPPSPSPSPTQPQEAAAQGDHKQDTISDNVGLEKNNPDVFARPQAPPRRFLIPKPQETNTTTTLLGSASTSQQTGNIQTTTAGPTDNSVAIPPAFTIQSPRPPPTQPLKPPTSSSGSVGKRFMFELPKFSVPPPPSYTAASSAPLRSQSSQHAQSTFKNVGDSAPNTRQFQLKMPSKPTPPLTRPTNVVVPNPNPPSVVERAFVLPSPRQFHLPTTNAATTTGDPNEPQKATTEITTDPTSNVPLGRQSRGSEHSTTVTGPSVHVESSTLPQESHTQYQQHTHDAVHQAAEGPHPHKQKQHATGDEMEISSDQVSEGRREVDGAMQDVADGDASFDPTSTSIDFGEMSVDFDSSAQFFNQQGNNNDSMVRSNAASRARLDIVLLFLYSSIFLRLGPSLALTRFSQVRSIIL